MPKLTNADRRALTELQATLETLHAAHVEALIEFGERLEELWDEVARPALEAYEAARDDMSEQLEDWASAFQDAVDDLPERSREDGDDNGWADLAASFKDASTAYAISLMDRLDAPVPPDPYEPCEALDEVFMDLGDD